MGCLFSMCNLKVKDRVLLENNNNTTKPPPAPPLHNRSWIAAVKKFTKAAWPDPSSSLYNVEFICIGQDEAWGVGKLRNKRLANLIGYCCEGDERLLVAEYMPILKHCVINES